MTSEEEPDAPRRSFRHLLNGYFLVVLGVFFMIFSFAGSFSPGGFGPLGRTLGMFVNSLGFLIVVYSHVYYLNLPDKEVFGIPVKYVFLSVAVTVILLGSVSIGLFDSYDLRNIGVEDHLLFILVIPRLVVFGIIYFNVLFFLAGPFYLILFYYFVVRPQTTSSPLDVKSGKVLDTFEAGEHPNTSEAHLDMKSGKEPNILRRSFGYLCSVGSLDVAEMRQF